MEAQQQVHSVFDRLHVLTTLESHTKIIKEMGEQQRKRYMVSTVFTHVLKLGWEAARHQGKKPRDQP